MNDLALYEIIPALDKNFPIKLGLHAFVDNGFAAHWHEHMEILFFTAGNLQMYCGNEYCEVGENDLVFINSNELHFSVKDENSIYWCMHISPSFFKDISCETILIENAIRQDPYIKELFQNMVREFEERSEGYDMAIKSLAYAFMTYVLRNYKKSKKEIGRFKESEARLRQLAEVFNYISLHYSEKLTTAALADRFFLNEQYFCKLFKQATGQSVIDYINRMRIDKAAVHLEQTSESATDIAAKVGFDDPNYFSRMFKRYRNVSPREYRKLVKSEPPA